MARKKKAEPPENHERWLVSYADFITLLFCFFTAMYAIGESNASKAAKFITSINEAFTPIHRRTSLIDRSRTSDGSRSFATASKPLGAAGFQAGISLDSKSPGGARSAGGHREDKHTDDLEELTSEETDGKEAAAAPAPTATPAPSPAAALPSPTPQNASAGKGKGAGELPADLEQAYEEIDRVLIEKQLKDKIRLVKDKRGLVISLSEAGFFHSGEAEMQPLSKTSLDQILPAVQGLGRQIEIEGHTDNTPIVSSRSKYSSNHALSAARASNTFDFLVVERSFDPSKIRLAGYGENRPIASNATTDGRARNRRVDIIIRSAQEAEI